MKRRAVEPRQRQRKLLQAPELQHLTDVLVLELLGEDLDSNRDQLLEQRQCQRQLLQAPKLQHFPVVLVLELLREDLVLVLVADLEPEQPEAQFCGPVSYEQRDSFWI